MSPSPTPTPPFHRLHFDYDRRLRPYPSEFFDAGGGGGYFAEQAYRAGFFGGGVGHNLLRIPASLSQGPVWDDRARRELEKRRIREEMMAREIMWRRELEEEVRQELALERELALRLRPADVPLSPLDSARPFPVPHLRDSLFREQLLQSQRAGAERGLFQRAPGERRLVEPKPVFEVGRSAAVSEETAPVPSISGVKRRLASLSPLPSISIGNLPIPKKARKEWNCGICQVTASSIQVFNDHLLGKKHKAKEAELLGEKLVTIPNKSRSEGTVNTKGKKLEFSAPKEFKRASTQKENKHLVDGSVDQVKKKKFEAPPRKKVSLFCEYCEVECFSEVVMSDHYRGKKHKARMDLLSKSVANCSKGSVILEESLKDEAAGVVTDEANDVGGSDNEDKRSEVGEQEVNDKLDLGVRNEEAMKQVPDKLVELDERSDMGEGEVNDKLDHEKIIEVGEKELQNKVDMGKAGEDRNEKE